MWKISRVPPLEAAGFRFHFLLRERAGLGAPGDHGAAGGVRSPPRAHRGLGFPPLGRPALLGPGTLQFLHAISGARPPPRGAGWRWKRTGRRGEGAGNGGSPSGPQAGKRGGAVPSRAEPRPGTEPGGGVAAHSLGARKRRVGRSGSGVGAPLGRRSAFPPAVPHPRAGALPAAAPGAAAAQGLGGPIKEGG